MVYFLCLVFVFTFLSCLALLWRAVPCCVVSCRVVSCVVFFLCCVDMPCFVWYVLCCVSFCCASWFVLCCVVSWYYVVCSGVLCAVVCVLYCCDHVVWHDMMQYTVNQNANLNTTQKNNALQDNARPHKTAYGNTTQQHKTKHITCCFFCVVFRFVFWFPLYCITPCRTTWHGNVMSVSIKPCIY